MTSLLRQSRDPAAGGAAARNGRLARWAQVCREVPTHSSAGGVGSRLSEETESKPKPMVEIGGKPILWHIMKHYARHGFKDFVIALGYKGEYIKRWFWDYRTEKVFAGPELAAPRWHPEDQPVPGPAGLVPPDWQSKLHE